MLGLRICVTVKTMRAQLCCCGLFYVSFFQLVLFLVIGPWFPLRLSVAAPLPYFFLPTLPFNSTY